MDAPISPAPVKGAGRKELPAYVSNGLIGLRVRETALSAGLALLNGYTGEHSVRRIEAAAIAPYPVAGDLRLEGVWMSDAPSQVGALEQSYDFSTGELTSRFQFAAGGATASVEVLTFCSRGEPSLVCQQISVECDAAADLALRSLVDGRNVDGVAMRYWRDTPGEKEPACDGAALWESAGGHSQCGIAYVTELLGAEAEAARPPLENRSLTTTREFRAATGRRYALRQIASMIPSVVHAQPDIQAVRQVALARRRGFEALRAQNRAIWQEIWRGRIRLVGAERRWQALADAAFFYLLSSTHVGSPASTSIFGLATWHDYHYYYGHVMWDIETFVVPVMSALQPHTATSLLDYRFRSLGAAAGNARGRGRRGLQFPWESAPSSGQEAAPMPGSASWHEDHVSLDVARAFALHAHMTGDLEYLRERAWPVLSGVAEWIDSRVTRSERGYEIRGSMGIAERQDESDNAVFANMSAIMVLRDAIRAAERLGYAAKPSWARIADEMVLPMRDRVIVSHDGFRSNEEKGGTPDPLMGIFPLGLGMQPEVEAATLEHYLGLSDRYIGSPMLSALYGVWAAYAGDRALSAKLMDEGYGQFCVGRFEQTLEYRSDVFPEQPQAGPFFANLAGFLMGLIFGFPGLFPDAGDPMNWARRPVVLPKGWSAIEVDRIWIHGRECRLIARDGAGRAELSAP